MAAVGHAATAPTPTPWSFSGSDLADTHAAYTANDGNQLSPANIRNLKLKWTFTTAGSVPTTPTVEQGGLYVPDTFGYLYKVNPDTGASIWTTKISQYTGNNASWSRTSPAISGNTLVIGESKAARIIAINKLTGAKIWSTLLNNYPLGTITSGPTIYNNVVYVGVAASEEAIATPGYTPVARGSVAALNLTTGALIWQFTTVPAGYTGGGIWGSSISVSPAWGSVFVGTGDNYSTPASVAGCVAGMGTNMKNQLSCLSPVDYIDSVLALDMNTGHLKWARRLGGADTWMPLNRIGRDADFASGVNLLHLTNFTTSYDDLGGRAAGYLLGAGEKGGTYFGLNPANGGLFWTRTVGLGDLLWGSAAGNIWSDYYIFSAMDNQTRTNKLLGQVGGAPLNWGAGFWSAIQASTGKLVWQVPAATHDIISPNLEASAPGGMSFTNGLVFAGDTGGNFVALDARTGFKYWTYNVGVLVKGSPAIFNNALYWGVGYQYGGDPNKPAHQIFAFAVP